MKTAQEWFNEFPADFPDRNLVAISREQIEAIQTQAAIDTIYQIIYMLAQSRSSKTEFTHALSLKVQRLEGDKQIDANKQWAKEVGP